MQIAVTLPAGQWVVQQTAGRYFVLLDTGAVSSIGLAIMRGTERLEELNTAKRGTKARTDGGFTHVMLRSAVATTVQLVISDGVVDVDAAEGATVNVTASTPLPVSNDRGSPGNLMYVSGVSLADAPATGLVEPAAVAVTSALTALVAANANRRALRFANLGPDPVAIGGAGLSWANRCVVLQAGDIWVEDRAGNVAWSAITAAGTTASVTVQGVTA